MDDPRITAFVRNVIDDNAVEAKKDFDDIMLGKIQDVIDDKKMEVAANLVGGFEEDKPDTEDRETQETEEPVEPQEDSNEQEVEGNTQESGTDN